MHGGRIRQCRKGNKTLDDCSGGYSGSLERVRRLYLNEHVTKDDFTKALVAYQEYLNEVKSDQRDEAASADDKYKLVHIMMIRSTLYYILCECKHNQ